MSRIAGVFQNPERKALIGFITVGYPDIIATTEAVQTLSANGCDIIELGIPFSDPLADGVTIQKASYRALQNGVTAAKCLDIAHTLRRTVGIPLLFMTYFNPVYSYGLASFCRDCNVVGVDGIIVPDLPPEEGTELEKLTKTYDIDLVYLLAPTSTDERIRLVAEKSRGFIYLVSVAGVTGTRDNLPADLGLFVQRVKNVTRTPLCVGFGISTAEQARQAAAMANGVIVGSRFIQLLKSGDMVTELANFTRELRNALDRR